MFRTVAGETTRFAGGCATIVTLAELRESAPWREAFHDKLKDHRFYELISTTLTADFEYFFLVLEDDDRVVRAIQPVFFVHQNLIEGLTGPARETVDRIQKKFPRFLTLKTLMVGCSAGQGHLGACRPEDAAWVAKALHHSL